MTEARCSYGRDEAESSPSISPVAAADLETLELSTVITRAQAGCADSFSEICRRFRPRLIRFLENRHRSDADDAEDVVQDALTKAWQNLASYRSEFKFTTWLYTILHRTAIDHQRRRSRQPDQNLRILDSAFDGTSLPVSTASSAEKILEVREESENLWCAAKTVLNDHQYAVLWLRFAEDLSIGEIAKVLGRTTVGIRVTLHRAKMTLRTKVQSGQPASTEDTIGAEHPRSHEIARGRGQ